MTMFSGNISIVVSTNVSAEDYPSIFFILTCVASVSGISGRKRVFGVGPPAAEKIVG